MTVEVSGVGTSIEGRRTELQLRANRDISSVGNGEWDVGGNAGVTGPTDECPSDGENLLGKQGYVKRLRGWSGTLHQVQNCLVARLVGHDGASRRKDGWVPNEWRGTQIRPDADVLNRTRDRRHGRDAGERTAEVEAAVEWLQAERSEDGLESLEVGRLVGPDGGELLDGDSRRSEARVSEVGGLELAERLRIELGLERLEHVRELEDGRGAIVSATAERRSRHSDGRNSSS